MSLKDFQTILVPAKDTGSLHFFHKPTKAILEAAFSRPDVGATSGASVFDKDGNLIELAENEPDWSFPIGGGCPRLLMRPQAENLVTYSENANFWATLNATKTFGAVSPDGTANADGFLETAVTNSHILYEDITATADVQYTCSVFVKGVGRDCQFSDLGGSGGGVTVDLQNGTITSVISPAINSFIEDCGNGWFRVGFTQTKSPTLYRLAVYSLEYGSANTNILGDITKGVLVWGFQLESASFATAYIPTNGGTITRSANQFTFDDLVNNGVIDSSAFTFLLDFKLPPNSGVNGSRIIRFRSDANAELLELVASLGGTSASWIAGSTLLGGYQDISTRKKLAISINGNLATVSLAGSTIALNIDMGGSLAITKIFAQMINGWALEMYGAAFAPMALSESDLNAATA